MRLAHCMPTKTPLSRGSSQSDSATKTTEKPSAITQPAGRKAAKTISISGARMWPVIRIVAQAGPSSARWWKSSVPQAGQARRTVR